MASKKDRSVRTKITLPASTKEKKSHQLDQIYGRNDHRKFDKLAKAHTAKAVILNEKVRRPAPKGWSSLKVIKDWRIRASS